MKEKQEKIEKLASLYVDFLTQELKPSPTQTFAIAKIQESIWWAHKSIIDEQLLKAEEKPA